MAGALRSVALVLVCNDASVGQRVALRSVLEKARSASQATCSCTVLKTSFGFNRPRVSR
ncbi:hypothetical protein PF005_g16441 [Phytophthora fragariae]|uniref:Uncharacterized protein n=2 Tax=Phytophthora TaxID=4783 RepID=A0A6A4DKX5_9STRA|nr:hypothetical protein PF003_g38257 [Phytophthora fragariae]KAE8962097.1 hypothetical protein PR002_g29704 [Phytophthora rubi]KAE8943751.1 hypothetical protein PF009_g6539 [Phytophthora fragariae]KAE8962441.1 hypothetical protein PR001_g29706 [Phytophthora rubi]KAE9007925.1 hypothetical protein PF011_g10904 [Phytophthora fragariae]